MVRSTLTRALGLMATMSLVCAARMHMHPDPDRFPAAPRAGSAPRGMSRGGRA